MTPEQLGDLDQADAQERLAEMRAMFVRVHDEIRQHMDAARDPSVSDFKAISSKLSELQTNHLTLLRAEEAFHDKFRTDAPKNTDNYDDIRRQVGRALSRLRDTIAAEGVSGGAVRSSD